MAKPRRLPSRKKKTLESDPTHRRVEKIPGQAASSEFDDEETDSDDPPDELTQQTGNGYHIDLDSLPVRLPPIAAEDLEHIEDGWLDAAYESRLRREGDDLRAIADAAQIATGLLGTETLALRAEPTAAPIALAASAAAASVEGFGPSLAEIGVAETEPAVQTLSDNPTDEELMRYAEGSPAVQRILKIFRGKITKVSKVTPGR